MIEEEWVKDFFSLVDEEEILKRRETHTIEFKETFEWTKKEFKAKIGKTAAAFSNNIGGIIIFGIADSPHKIVGVNNFDAVDEEQITTYFNNYFTPSIIFTKHTFLYKDKKIGYLKIYESKTKPIICIKDSTEIYDTEIYYRYSGKSTKIKSGDLIILINQIKQDINEKWLLTLKNIGSIGIDNIGILNSISGEIYSTEKRQYILDQQIIDQIKFLNNYSEAKEGAPAIKIIGEVESSATLIPYSKMIYDEDIFKAFLLGTNELSSKEYFNYIVNQQSPYYPIYWLLNDLASTHESQLEYIKNVRTHAKNRIKILERIETKDKKLLNPKHKFTFSSESKLGLHRKRFSEKIFKEEKIIIIDEKEAQIFFETILSLERGDFEAKYLKEQLLIILKQFYPFEKNGVYSLFRKVLSYIDCLISME